MDIRRKHLSSEERGVILAEHNRGSSQRCIGQLLHRPASTICRELARGRQEDGFYCPQAARQAYDDRRARCHRKASLWKGATFIVSFMASSYICTGRLSRLRRHCVS